MYIINKYKEKYFDNKSDIINLTGALTLREYCALISQLDLLITIDSSALHIAGHFDIDTVCLFGETLPKLRSIYYKNCKNIIESVGCRNKTGSCYLDSKSFYHADIGCNNANQQQSDLENLLTQILILYLRVKIEGKGTQIITSRIKCTRKKLPLYCL